MNSDKKNSLSNNGYVQSAYDSNKYVNKGSGSWVKDLGNNNYGFSDGSKSYNSTNKDFNNRTKK